MPTTPNGCKSNKTTALLQFYTAAALLFYCDKKNFQKIPIKNKNTVDNRACVMIEWYSILWEYVVFMDSISQRKYSTTGTAGCQYEDLTKMTT